MSDPVAERLARLAAEVGDSLRRRGATLAVAESCTGGLIAAAMTQPPGASDVFWGGAVVYSAAAKSVFAGIDDEIVRRHGTVAVLTTEALAAGIRQRSGATWGLAVTGWAGPEAGEGAALGTVHAAVADARRVGSATWSLPGDRDAVRTGAALQALGLLHRQLRETQDGR